jgi:hypothetical protein
LSTATPPQKPSLYLYYCRTLVVNSEAPSISASLSGWDLEAEDLTLWSVSIPVVPVNKHEPIVLREVDSPTELNPTDDVSEAFPPPDKLPKKTIQIIVQRTSSGNAVYFLCRLNLA